MPRRSHRYQLGHAQVGKVLWTTITVNKNFDSYVSHVWLMDTLNFEVQVVVLGIHVCPGSTPVVPPVR